MRRLLEQVLQNSESDEILKPLLRGARYDFKDDSLYQHGFILRNGMLILAKQLNSQAMLRIPGMGVWVLPFIFSEYQALATPPTN